MLHWKLKACTRCGGDLFVVRDMDGWFAQCLQCSHRSELRDYKRQLVGTSMKHIPLEDWSKGEE